MSQNTFFENWMSYISDDALLRKVAIIGSHNSGSYGLKKIPCCQDGNMYDQYKHGVRQFCIRLHTDKDGVIRLAHGRAMGDTFESGLSDLKKILDESSSDEFFIFDIQEYYPQKIGPIVITCQADKNEVDALLEKYIQPKKYALADFDVETLTLGEAKKDGKRYILYNHRADYKYSVDCVNLRLWNKKIYGMNTKKFLENAPKLMDEIMEADTKVKHYKEIKEGKFPVGFMWFQLQRTPGIGTEEGLKSPRKFDHELKPYFADFMKVFSDNPVYLERSNIFCGDFMTDGFYKAKEILKINMKKGIVKEDMLVDYYSNVMI